jgi:hypothetical protein
MEFNLFREFIFYLFSFYFKFFFLILNKNETINLFLKIWKKNKETKWNVEEPTRKNIEIMKNIYNEIMLFENNIPLLLLFFLDYMNNFGQMMS